MPFIAISQPVDVLISQGTANTCNGVLFDTGGQGGTGYQNNESFTLTICPDTPGDVITVVFNTFNLDPTDTQPGNGNNQDNLHIYDGNSIAAADLGTYATNSLQGTIVSTTSGNTSGCLTFVFTSNDVGTGVFSGTITCSTPCQPPSALFTSPTVAQNPQLICQGETVNFDASGSTAQASFTIADYIFDYGDGLIDTLQTPTASHAFANPGEYLVKLTVIDDNGCTNMNSEIIKIWVSTTPYFNTLVSDSVICLGESSCLDGGVDFTPVTYTPTPGSSLTGTTYLPDDVGSCFTATLDYGFFTPGQTLTDINDLLGICVNMEHSYMGDLVTTITCPNGTSVVMHQQNGGGTNLGYPDQADDSTLVGVGWDYCWSPTATNGTWEENSQFGITPNTMTNSTGSESLIPGTYESVNPLTPLVGCPLNGIWEIEFCDLFGADDGFVFDFWLDLDSSLYPSLTTFTPSIGMMGDSTYWNATAPNDSYITSTSNDSNVICITPTAAGVADYTFIANDNFGCSYDTTISVTVVPNYTFTSSQTDSLVCLGEEIQFNITPNSVLPLNYSWQPANIFDDATSATPIATIYTPGATMVTVDINNGAACLKTDTFYVFASNAFMPQANIIPNDTSLNCGDPLNLNIDLGGGVPGSCGLSASNACTQTTNQTTIGNGTSNISIDPSPYNGYYHDARIQIIYTAVELNAMGFSGGKITEIAFNITNQASSAPYNNFNIKMGCTASSDFNGATLFETGLSQVYSNASYSSIAGWNTHVLNSAYEWDGNTNLIVEICFDNTAYTSRDEVSQTNTPNEMTLFDFTDGDTGCSLNSPSTYFERPDILLTHCATTVDPTAYTYSWTPSLGLTDSTIINPIATPATSTNYIVTVSDQTGLCSDTDTIPVTINITSTANVDSVDVSCFNGNDGKIIVNIAGTGGPYTVEYFDSLGTLIQTNNSAQNDSLTNLTIGTYMVKVTDLTGCPIWDTLSINQPTPVLLNGLTSDTTICIGGSAILYGSTSGGTGTNSLVWDHNLIGDGPHAAVPTDSLTVYYVYAQDSLGCSSAPDSIVVLWNDSLRVADLIGDTLCQDGAINSTSLTAVVTGGNGNYNYEWYNGTNTVISTNKTIAANPSTNPETFTVIVRDGCANPETSTSVDIYLLPRFTPTFTSIAGDACNPDTLVFVNTTLPTNINTVLWDFGDGNTSSLLDTATHVYTTPGTYNITLRVTNIAGCVEDTISLDHVVINAIPSANFSYSPINPTTFDTEITFENLSSGNTFNSWTFEEGTPINSSEGNPTIVFPNDEPGRYAVQLTVTSAEGCVDSTSGIFVQIDGVYLLYVPNAFTPNGDGINDEFIPLGNDVELTDYTFDIFNRWGELLFQTNTLSSGWNGTFKGKEVPNGSYVWKIRAKEKYSTIIHKDWGHVNLTR